ncbi:MAG TPA: hypothetical protein VNO32_38180 [Candidatus Acidoferrum sp.]|jgi:hypothetical protein|nr:hypothetical protein [Candidatus Acidoferrum sp.]
MQQQLMTEPSNTLERAEDRMVVKTVAMLVGRHARLGVEKAITETLSSRDAGVISESEWYVDDTILVSLPAENFTSAARVVRCEVIGGGQFRTALEFV